MNEKTIKLLKTYVYDVNEQINKNMSFEDMLEYYESWKTAEEKDFWKYLKSIWAITWA